MDKTRNTFTSRLNFASSRKGVTQADIAKKVKATPNTVNRWFKGHRFPDPEMIDELAGILSVTPAWLFGAEELEPQRDTLLIRGIQSIQKIESLDRVQLAVEAIEALVELQDEEKQKIRDSKKKA